MGRCIVIIIDYVMDLILSMNARCFSCRCFLSHVGAFWGAFLAPILAIMLFNVVLFVCISVVLIRHVKRRSSRKAESSKQTVVFRTSLSIFGLMCLFGLTWLFAILTFSAPGLRETFQVFFTVFNSLQGAFIFLFTCVLSADAREGWKSVFCRGRRSGLKKLSNYSSYKPGSSSTGTSTLQPGSFFSNPWLKVSTFKSQFRDWGYDIAFVISIKDYSSINTTASI